MGLGAWGSRPTNADPGSDPNLLPASHKDGDLTVGESACIDRCTAKYWQATGIVGQLLGGSGAIGR